MKGVDGPPDAEKALRWFLTAADYGLHDSQYNLGVIYARGLGATQDLVTSYKWFAIAAAQGDPDAKARRDEVEVVVANVDTFKKQVDFRLLGEGKPRPIKGPRKRKAPPKSETPSKPAKRKKRSRNRSKKKVSTGEKRATGARSEPKRKRTRSSRSRRRSPKNRKGRE